MDIDLNLTEVNEWVSLGCVVGGILMIILAGYMFHNRDRIVQKIEDAVGGITPAATTAAQNAAAAPTQGVAGQQGIAAGTTPQAAALNGAAEYIRALGDLSDKLSKVTPAIAALLVSTILFFFAAVIATADTIDDGDKPDQSSSQEESTNGSSNADDSGN